jgi:putative ABC transport system permease protein
MSGISRGNLKTAFTSVRTAKWRSFLTMLGIIIGIVSVVSIVGIGAGMKQQVSNQISHFGKDLLMVRPGKVADPNSKQLIANSDLLFGRTSFNGLTIEDYKTVKNTEGVKATAPLGVVSGEAMANNGRQMQNGLIIATSPDLPAVINQKVHFGSSFDDSSELSSAVIGQQVAYDLFGQSVPLGKTFTLRGQSFTVRGIFSEFRSPPLSPTANFDNAIFIPYQMASHLTNSTTQFYTVLAKPSNPKAVAQSKQDIQNSLTQKHGGQEDFSVLDRKDSVAMSGGIIDLLTTFISAVAAISLIVGGIGIMNIMLVSVTERMHEIGIRKAVGATNRQILNQFMLESTVLSVIGGIVGIICSIIVILLLRTYTSYRPIISWEALAVATLVSVAVGIIFGTAPAVKAARKDPIEALRHE